MISTREAKEMERERELVAQDLRDAVEFELDVDDELDARRRLKSIAKKELAGAGDEHAG